MLGGFGHAEEHLIPKAALTARLENMLEISAVALGLGFPEGHRALRVQLVRAEETEVVEKHSIDLHADQGTRGGLLNGPDQADIDRHSELLRRRNVDAGPAD